MRKGVKSELRLYIREQPIFAFEVSVVKQK